MLFLFAKKKLTENNENIFIITERKTFFFCKWSSDVVQ